jgi:hypothetical protein
MEPEVQKAPAIPRSELDTAFDVSRRRGWMVVQSVPTAPWGYELFHPDGAHLWRQDFGLPVVVELSEDR